MLVITAKNKTAVHVALTGVWNNRFMVLIDPLAETRQENSQRLATGQDQARPIFEPLSLFEHTPTPRRRKEVGRSITSFA